MSRNSSSAQGDKTIMKRYLLSLLCIAFTLLQGCALVSGKPGLTPLDSGQIHEYIRQDDQGFANLRDAVEQSLRYYRGLPDKNIFDYAGLIYSAREMEASTLLFLGILDKYEGERRLAEIQESFLFFESRNGDGAAFFTGYYEPLLRGSLEPTNDFPTPLYGIPDDLITMPLKLFSDKKNDIKAKKIIGRLVGNEFVPYDSREDIMYRSSLRGRVAPLVYLENDIELFFLQIQGSGIVQLRDGSCKRVNYGARNGHPYRAIGALLKKEIPQEEMSLQALKRYLYAHPEQEQAILTYNPSYTFFREVREGPLGNIEVPLTPGRSIAMDRDRIPRGSLAFIDTSYPPMNEDERRQLHPLQRFAVVQDTGGAIRGHGRADIFWGKGKEAELIAGHMKEHGRVFVLVAKKKALAALL